MKKYLVVLFLGVSVLACNNKQIDNIERDALNFTIQYDFDTADMDSEDKYRHKFDVNKLYLFIEEEFKNDIIKVYVNEKLSIEENVNTDLSTGLAKVIELDDIALINSIGLRINNSPLISFEIFDKKMNLIGVDKRKKNVKIVFYKKTPVFY